MELKKLVKNTSYLASTKVVQFIVGIIRSKINAVLLGTVGVGIVNQLTFLSSKMGQFTMLSMSEAVVKQIAQNKDNENVPNIVAASLKSYIVLVFSFMLVSGSVFYIFSNQLTNYVLGDTKYKAYFYIALFSFPLLIINSIPFAILKGFKDVASISKARIAIIIANLLVFVPLVYLYRLKGAVIFIPISYMITLAANYYFVRKNHLKRLNLGLSTILKTKFNKAFSKEILLFSGFGLIVGTYGIFSEFACRSIVIENLGVDKIGLYSPVIVWSGLFTGFIIPSFSTYLYPRFAEAKSNPEITGILNDAIRFSTFALIPLLFLAIPFRNVFIPLLYSKEFIEAGNYLPYHFIGVVFYVWWYIFTQAMTPTGRIRQHATLFTVYMTLDIVVTYITVPIWGLNGWMLKHIISPFVFFFVYLFFWHRKIRFKIYKPNIIVMLYLLFGSFMLIGVGFISDNTIISYVLGVLLLLLSWFLLSKNEHHFMLKKVSNIY
jgi:O-antigen/teichoic acid export membrane protein